eukprot:1379568-Karenia_brevis.AAC.1
MFRITVGGLGAGTMVQSQRTPPPPPPLDKSILTLYMSITGGNDWGMYYEASRGVFNGQPTHPHPHPSSS